MIKFLYELYCKTTPHFISIKKCIDQAMELEYFKVLSMAGTLTAIGVFLIKKSKER